MQNEGSRKSGTDALGRYYTASIVGSTLVQKMKLENPKTIMDLGVGDGALTVEASKIWATTKFVTVDIDSRVNCKDIIANNHHHTNDVLNSKLHSQIGLALESIDGAICNPPYIRPRWRKDFAEILEDAGLSGILPSIQDVSADVLFVAQNLRFVRTLGRLGLILSDGLIAGEKYLQFRRTFLVQHKIERVIELPRGIFNKTEAKTHIVIMTKKEQPEKSVIVERMGLDGSLSTPLQIPISTAIQRLDYSYLENHKKPKSVTTFVLGDVSRSLSRGKLCSKDVRNAKVNVFHSTDFPSIIDHKCPVVPEKFLISSAQSATLNTALAQAGDILICRVGRNLERKICYVHKGQVALSDCVYKLQVAEEFREKVMTFLCGSAGRSSLSASAHGVGAKYLSKVDLLNFIIEIN
jgi:type I restriction enzyme M protein